MDCTHAYLIYKMSALVSAVVVIFLGYRLLNVALFRTDDTNAIFEKSVGALLKRALPGLLITIFGGIVFISSSSQPFNPPILKEPPSKNAQLAKTAKNDNAEPMKP